MVCKHGEDNIEGVVFKNERGEWVIDVAGIGSCRIDFCPWCGSKL